MSPAVPATRSRVAFGILGQVDAAGGAQLPSTDSLSIELVPIGADESLDAAIARIQPEGMLLVYRGYDDRVAIPVDVAVPVDLVFDADTLTGWGRGTAQERTATERGVTMLRALAPSVRCAYAPSEPAAEFLRGACGFERVVVDAGPAREPASAEAPGAASSTRSVAPELSVRVEGPFDSTYSLAVVNAGLAQGLAGLADVGCTLAVAPGDQVAPDELTMRKNPQVAHLWTRSRHAGHPDAIIRNCYPPLPEGMDARGRFLYFFWEDSRISPEWVSRFNEHLTGVLAPTKHVVNVLRDSGVDVPIAVIGCGLDEQALVGVSMPTVLPTQAGFKFLHISSGFPRKGVDVLLDAYFAGFSASDDVCLVIKTFPNIHNTTAEYLERLRRDHPDAPDVVCIEQDLPDYAYYGLYSACDCLVSATRCEGFGLPMAEAMAFGLPVIVTDYSGHTDFCDESTAFMVESTLVETGSHLKVDGSMWAEPSRESLREQMRYVFENRDGAEVAARVRVAKQRAQLLTWHNTARAAADFVRSTLDAS